MTGRSTSSTAIVDPRRPLTTASTITITITIDESPRARTPSKDRFERLPLRTLQLYDRLRSFTEHGTRAVHYISGTNMSLLYRYTHEGKRFGEGNTNTHRKESISGKGMRAEDGSWPCLSYMCRLLAYGEGYIDFERHHGIFAFVGVYV